MRDDKQKWEAGGQGRIRKAPKTLEESLPAAKRQMSASPSSIAAMEMTTSDNSPVIPSADDVLVQVRIVVVVGVLITSNSPRTNMLLTHAVHTSSQMIRQSGAQTYGEVVEFCRSTGIPLSRMLSLDLMRQLPSQRS